MLKFGKKKEIFKVKSQPVDPAALAAPKTPVEFLNRGMAYYARKQYPQAVDDLKQSVALDAGFVDAHYSLGLVYKAMGKTAEAQQYFQKAIQILVSNPGESHDRKEMLRRLALGHINAITMGDWNLEKEIWKHIS